MLEPCVASAAPPGRRGLGCCTCCLRDALQAPCHAALACPRAPCLRRVDGVEGVGGGEDLDGLAVARHKAAGALLAARGQHAVRGGVAAQGDERQRGLPARDAPRGVRRQLGRQAGAAADGVGQRHVAATRHPLALPLKGGDEPPFLRGGRGRRAACSGSWHWHQAHSTPSGARIGHMPLLLQLAGRPWARGAAPPCRRRGRWGRRWRAHTRTDAAASLRLHRQAVTR